MKPNDFPSNRSAIAWPAIRPAVRGRSPAVGRTLSQAQQDSIERKYGNKLHVRSVGKYLTRWGFTPQVGGPHQDLSMIATATNHGKTRWMIIDDAVSADKLVEFRAALTQDMPKKVFLIKWTPDSRLQFEQDPVARNGQFMSETKTRQIHLPEFKAKVGLEALRGVRTINEIAQDYAVPPVQVSQWKNEIQQQAKSLFEGNRGL